MVGCLKLLLNLTYDDAEACNRVRLAKYGNSVDVGGLGTITTLLNLRFAEKEQFDIRQHIISLLINLVEISPTL